MRPQGVPNRAFPRDFRIGEWLVQPSLNRVSREGQSLQLEPRTMDTLAYLAHHVGRVVPRMEIIEAVWEREFVADATLSHTVAELRSALGDDARRPRYIETISKRGYRLVAPVCDVGEALPGRVEGFPAIDASTNFPLPPSIAVLPFADMSSERDHEYLCEGIVEEITSALAQIERMRVAARTSAFAFRGKLEDAREIGRKLGVGAVLEGSVRSAGNRLRISVQLINVADGYHLWSERFDRTGDDIFAIQDEIALGVVERLKVSLREGEADAIGRRRTASRDAYDLYLKGRYFLNRRRGDDMKRAVESFERAVAMDPTYSLPHVGISESFAISGLWGFLPPALACGRAKAAAARAIEIDDSLAEAHAWIASVLYLHDWDWPRATFHGDRAARLPLPAGTSAFGVALHWLAHGQRDEALDVGRRQLELEPLSAVVHSQNGALRIGVGDFDGAVALLEKALELDPDMPVSQCWLGFCHSARGDATAALEPLRFALARGWTASMVALPGALVRAGRREEALELVHSLDETSREHYVTPFIGALAWAALDDRGRSLHLLAQAEAERSPMLSLSLFGSGYLALAPEWVKEWFADLRRRIAPDLAVARATAGGFTSKGT